MSKPERGAFYPTKSFLLWALFIAFVGGGFYSGWLSVPRFLGWVESVAPASFTQTILPFVQVTNTNKVAPDWKNLERVNVLVMGTDARPHETDIPTRTDTMMLLTLDPYSKSAGMLSIPRDLYVPIPVKQGNVIQDRINTAHFYGQWHQYPGGGPALAKETVQYNLGVRVHYFVLLDFEGFERIIDAVGGVNVDVESPITDSAYPTSTYGYMRVHIPAGQQMMDGEHALIYARTRNADSDFGRMKRQQNLLLAVRSRLMQLDVLPKVPGLWNEFRDSVKTDMSLSELLTIAQIAREVPEENISGGSLDGEYVNMIVDWGGAHILVPNRNRMRDLVNRIFFDPRRQEESAKIEILNGTNVKGLAGKTAQILESHGFREVAVGDFATAQPVTQVQNLNGKSYTAGVVASLLKVPKERVVNVPRPTGTDADIRIILGDDAQ